MALHLRPLVPCPQEHVSGWREMLGKKKRKITEIIGVFFTRVDAVARLWAGEDN